MSATPAEARDQIFGLLLTAWQTQFGDPPSIPLLWKDTDIDPPLQQDADNNPEPWARVSLLHKKGGIQSLRGDSGNLKYRQTGNLIVKFYEPLQLGNNLADQIVQLVLKTYTGKTTSGGVWFRPIGPREVGGKGAWWETDVLVSFEYDNLLK